MTTYHTRVHQSLCHELAQELELCLDFRHIASLGIASKRVRIQATWRVHVFRCTLRTYKNIKSNALARKSSRKITKERPTFETLQDDRFATPQVEIGALQLLADQCIELQSWSQASANLVGGVETIQTLVSQKKFNYFNEEPAKQIVNSITSFSY